MYCNSCKTEVNISGKFCPNCGSAVSDASAVGRQDVLSFIDGKIKAQTTFLSTSDFLQGAKPLKFRWVITFIGALVTCPWYCWGAIPAFIISMFVCSGKLIKLNARQYPLPAQVNIEKLGDFLRQSLSTLPFSEWQVGVPTAFGIRASADAVQCVFENKTVHRVVFEEGKNVYKIVAQGATAKQHFLRGGALASSGLTYKNAYRTQPILAAAVEYYFQQEKSGVQG